MTDFESFKRIPDFPDYQIGSKGSVYNTVRNMWMTWSPTEKGDMTVGLSRGGRQYRRSVKVLVARAFVEGESLECDTPILKDGDKNHIHADNIAWRPRWFAWHYHQQFSDTHNLPSWAEQGPLQDTTTGLIYETVYHAAVHTASLMGDIRMSLLHHNKVYPHGGIFVLQY